jgi:hypothetical protein
MTTIRIGVVSYVGSRFSESQGDRGLGRLLEVAFDGLGIAAEVRISTEDYGDRYGVQVTPRAVQESLTEQLRIQLRWSKFLNQQRRLHWWCGYGLRLARRAVQRVDPPPVSMISRLLNIEAAHRDLLAWGSEKESDWVLILEDDAASYEVGDLAEGLGGIVHASPSPCYVNLSESFSSADLGVGHLLSVSSSARWDGSRQRAILESTLPITNTVCAILYRADFARRLVNAYEELPLDPVLPIDWKLNAALMLMHDRKEVSTNECWQVEPAPILQMSMR